MKPTSWVPFSSRIGFRMLVYSMARFSTLHRRSVHRHTKGFRGRIRWSSRQCRKDVFVLIAGLRDWGVKSRCMLCSRAAAEYQESLHHSRNVWNVGTCLFRRVPRRLISTDRKRHRVRCLSRLLSGPECFAACHAYEQSGCKQQRVSFHVSKYLVIFVHRQKYGYS